MSHTAGKQQSREPKAQAFNPGSASCQGIQQEPFGGTPIASKEGMIILLEEFQSPRNQGGSPQLVPQRRTLKCQGRCHPTHPWTGSQQRFDVIIPILGAYYLRMRKLRPREVKQFVQSHLTNTLQNKDSHPQNLCSQPLHSNCISKERGEESPLYQKKRAFK